MGSLLVVSASATGALLGGTAGLIAALVFADLTWVAAGVVGGVLVGAGIGGALLN